ncbi:hypothetical protein AAY24_17990 [Sedimenticola thiotaurini]|uniref:Uncharacterized protein n=1 Tax=Sedimenticola thiotaurini TaxID=1543721 RepID=A0A0F7K039_9GAMM|nr:hypothetical protein AAY24_17990 [Sedimenticola thiotaurini]
MSWTEAQRLERLTVFYEQEYRDFSRIANDAAERAGRMGDVARAETWQRTADMLNDWASDRAIMADEVWIRRTAIPPKN